ncbi:hypothetical protein E2562_031401 [Oryza meyeriana var. granulata]|uniref:Uncharacterized protein n=1 Tax=Oryza meyeriana var. granulata TaxID=110450 RepID=A0A6G1C1W9_9ORYZ|nr:hypothetical protein E2562_031401 [Oryza meyeriana var. granulata]
MAKITKECQRQAMVTDNAEDWRMSSKMPKTSENGRSHLKKGKGGSSPAKPIADSEGREKYIPIIRPTEDPPKVQV